MSPEPTIKHGYGAVGDVILHYVVAGSGPAVVLLHGWPQTWYEWRHVLPVLAQKYTVIAPDLRGLGDSTRPLHGYDKKTIANDVWRLVHDHLGHTRFHLVGHDWGGPTAFALACAHAGAVRTLTIIDVVIPGDGGDFSEGGRRWHHQFHITPDLPEALIEGRERIYLQWFYQTFAFQPDAVPDAALDEFVRTYSQPGALRAGFSYYRQIARDVKDNAALLATGFRLPMPVLAIGGAISYPHGRGRGGDVEASMRRVADNVRGVVVADCGHFVPEEKPDELCAELLAFFDRG